MDYYNLTIELLKTDKLLKNTEIISDMDEIDNMIRFNDISDSRLDEIAKKTQKRNKKIDELKAKRFNKTKTTFINTLTKRAFLLKDSLFKILVYRSLKDKITEKFLIGKTSDTIYDDLKGLIKGREEKIKIKNKV